MRLGIFGGSFDPVHNGHLALAQACQTQAALDEVWFTPAAIQPFKQRGPHAHSDQRVEMLRLATAMEASWRVCTLEIERGGVSYTVETLRRVHMELPDGQLFLLLGADPVRDLPHWREAAEVCRLAMPLVVCRAGEPEPDLSPLEQLCAQSTRPRLINMPAVDISSREIRRRVAQGQSIDQYVPAAVANFIASHGLYR